MVQERGEDIIFRGRRSSAIFGVFVLAVRNLIDHPYEWGHPLSGPGCYGAAAELELLVIIKVSGQ